MADLAASPGARMVLKVMLPPLLYQPLRDYDLESGAAVLRAMSYAGPTGSWAFRLGLSFLTHQQDAQGRFGYLGKESRAIVASGELAAADLSERL
jgi:hypothetical protein